MFLGLLKEEEKNAFLELAHYLARSDGDFSDKQKEIISTYCFEMNIDDIDYNAEKFDLNYTLSKFLSEKSKKIVLLEVMALIYSDEYIHLEEQKIIDIMLEKFELNNTISNIYLEWTKTILAVSEQGKLLLEL